MQHSLYFALWAEDINRYLHCGYNAKSINKIRVDILSYINEDQDNPEGLESASLLSLLKMTGLTLDVSYDEFNHLDFMEEYTLNVRRGGQVNNCYLQ